MLKPAYKKILALLTAAWWLLAVLIFGVAHQQFDHIKVESDAFSPSMTTGELYDGHELRQALTVPGDVMESIGIMTLPSAASEGRLILELLDEEGLCLASAVTAVGELPASQYVYIPLEEPVSGRLGETLVLSLKTEGCAPGSSLLVFFGDSIAAGKFDIAAQITDSQRFTMDGVPGPGVLCVKLSGQKHLGLQGVYWLVVCLGFGLMAAAVLVGIRREKAGRSSRVMAALDAAVRYQFLMQQLVNRDFMTKYKRSILGVFWSFLNPLLTMAVQYVVFSTLFRSNVPYFAVYLLTGLVFYGFFSEACTLGISSITGNAALIKKVYMPKYIYPFSRVLSSLVNLVISLIPLFLVALLSGLPLRPSMLLLLFDILCLLLFVAGMVLILSTMMTFFQDTQFLWGIVSMMWMYLTPIFYPETIIPAKFLSLYRMNPLYQYISFARTCIIDGVSPAPGAYLWCLLSGLAVLILGLLVFKRNQDKFILYL